VRPRTLSPETSRRGFAVGVLCRRVSVTIIVFYGRLGSGVLSSKLAGVLSGCVLR